MPTFTALVAEDSSPCPPCYPDPLLFSVRVENPEDSESILSQVAEARALDLCLDDNGETDPGKLAEIKAGLRLLLVLPGDLIPAADWRT